MAKSRNYSNLEKAVIEGNFEEFQEQYQQEQAAKNAKMFKYLIEKALKLAVANERLEIIKFIFSNGYRQRNGNLLFSDTAIGMAMEERKYNLIQFLQSLGEKINNIDQYGRSCLEYVCSMSDIEGFHILLQNGANINITSDEGINLLGAAAIHGNIKMMKILIENGVKINHFDSYGRHSIHLAAKNRQIEPIKLLVGEGVDIHITPHYHPHETLLNTALAIRSLVLIKSLFEMGYNIQQRDGRGYSVLHSISQRMECPSLLKYFINRGLSVNETVVPADYDNNQFLIGFEPIHCAIMGFNPQNIACLSKKGANLFSRVGEHKFTLIHIAALFSSLHTFKFLLLLFLDYPPYSDEYQKSFLHEYPQPYPIIKIKTHKKIKFKVKTYFLFSLSKKRNNNNNNNNENFIEDVKEWKRIFSNYVIDHRPDIINMKDANDRSLKDYADDIANQSSVYGIDPQLFRSSQIKQIVDLLGLSE